MNLYNHIYISSHVVLYCIILYNIYIYILNTILQCIKNIFDCITLK